jgi:hypothetical protein
MGKIIPHAREYPIFTFFSLKTKGYCPPQAYVRDATEFVSTKTGGKAKKFPPARIRPTRRGHSGTTDSTPIHKHPLTSFSISGIIEVSIRKEFWHIHQ